MATTAQLPNVLSRSRLDAEIRTGELLKVWPGVYSAAEPDDDIRSRAVEIYSLTGIRLSA
ncbi:hypothetical protein BRW64_02275 [Mycolicibacterium diernhoferi]|uniref:Uncharacterized protein n=1 Tax=Mycolicibacterium diernhoferi TaxID=1801 RepID=A0A1Q4HLN5_9MYCO|nr:hypothetical protein BRW64_02275 [Mycolicibacterium diernhoferi]OPE55246.1 hypothetical protein BV510_06160 [Mycolicibacterium diernhoferi]PEG52056.1 hypothetical protein CRI78_23210 [Mycolicibacterium diernhoferi]